MNASGTTGSELPALSVPFDPVGLKAAAGRPPGDAHRTVAAEPEAPFVPVEPHTIEEAGIGSAEIEALVLKFLLNCGAATGKQIAEQLQLSPGPCGDVLQKLKADLLIGYTGSAAMGDFVYELTEPGTLRARRHAERCSYFGAAPVTLQQYVESVRRQLLSNTAPSRIALRDAFTDLSLQRGVFDQLGEALTSGRSLFLYGSPGNGKTSIAERITKAYGEHIWIPRTLSITGELIRLYDPSNHQAVPASAVTDQPFDRRWVPIRRPTIVVGGELRLEQLDIRFNPQTGINEAPVHLKSNCGTLVVDDFGRQQVSTSELLNRWIVPLEKQVDYLNLPSGRQIEVPFEQFLVLATNLEPRELVDEAFLRRIPYKIEVHDPSDADFRELFRELAPRMGVKHNERAVHELIEHHYTAKGRPFRYCHVRDLLLQVRNRCFFRQCEPELTTENLDAAVRNYFSVL